MSARLGQLTLAATLCAVLAFAAPAAAAPIELGTGSSPEVAVDEAGTAHITWNAKDAGAPDRMFYCQWPRTAKACTNARTFTPPLDAFSGDTYVFARPGGRIVIATHRCCGEGAGNYVYESTDGGLNFGAGRAVGTLNPHQQVVFGPGDSISVSAARQFQNSPLGGGGPLSSGVEFEDFPPTDASVALFNGAIPVHARSDIKNTSFHVYDGSGSLNDPANWAGPTAIPAGREVRLAGGPGGLALLYERGSGNKRYLAARMFDGTTFGSEAVVSERAVPIFPALGSTPFAPGFHAVWIDNREPEELRWSRSPDGVNWNAPFTAVRGGDAGDAFNLRVAGAPDGRAVAVFDGNSYDGKTRAIRLPEKGQPPTDTAAVGQYSFKFFAPFNCVPKGPPLTMTVSTKARKGVAKNKRVTLQRAVFRLGTTNLIDKKLSYSASFPTTDLVAGESYKVSAAVLYKGAGGGKSKGVGMFGVARVCP